MAISPTIINLLRRYTLPKF